MKKYVIGFLILLTLGLIEGHLCHEAALGGYINGCKDVMLDLYSGLGIKNPDQNSLNSYCHALSRNYIKK